MKTHSKSIFNIFTLFALLISLLGSAAFTPVYAAPATYNVTNCAKDNGGAGQLRTLMNAAASGDTINIPACTITIQGATGEDLNASGDLDFTKNLTITGAGADSTIIDGGAIDRVFHVTGAYTVNISGVTIRNGNIAYYNYGGGGILNNGGTLTVTNSTFSGNSATDGGGGAIDNNGGTLTVTNSTFSGNSADVGGGIDSYSSTLTVTNSTFSDNSATRHDGGYGGGINNYGTLTVTNSTFSGNSALVDGVTDIFGGYGGGGISNFGTLTVTNSTFSGNSAVDDGEGGGIRNDGGTLTVTNSTFSGNSADVGGGIANYEGTLTVTNSTFSSNSAFRSGGGGISNYGALSVTNSTLSGNSSSIGGGGISNYSGGTTTLQNSIVANSLGDNDCSSAITADSYNLDSDGSCGGATQNTTSEINLGTLADNGGPTQTFALLAGSSAIDAGDDTICAATPVSNTSQNGITRPQGAHCDVGSYEKALIFADVPFSHWANSYIESLYNAGITGGCSTSPLMYCPEATMTRAQMAIFILRGIHGSAYTPPPATGTIFTDVPADAFAADWIEQLALEGITSGCGDGNYCPDASITRAEMAIFLLRGEHGSVYTPPPATGTVFGDVPLGSFADAWIEQLASEGITTGCGGGNYCPDSPVTRAEMAVFLVKALVCHKRI